MSARRAARAAVGVSPAPATGGDVFSMLSDPEHEIWQDHDSFLAFMDERCWSAGVVGLMPNTHPHNRRNAASAAWGVANGITADDRSSFADWHALRRMGLIGEGTAGGLNALTRAYRRTKAGHINKIGVAE